MSHTFDIILIAMVAGGIIIWLFDRTNKKSYKASDIEVLRILAISIIVLGIALGFAILG